MQASTSNVVVLVAILLTTACADDEGSNQDSADFESVATAEQGLSGDSFAAADFGFVGASWDWTGPSSLSNIELVVADWGCDAKPVYAYLQFGDGHGWWDRTPTNRWDYSGCDLGDNTTYRGLGFSTTAGDIAYVFAVICRKGGPCHAGHLSDRNPYDQ